LDAGADFEQGLRRDPHELIRARSTRLTFEMVRFGEPFFLSVNLTRCLELLPWRRYGWVLLTAALLFGAAFWVRSVWRGMAPLVPLPLNPDKLDPQLRDYVFTKIQWAREKPSSPDRQATLGLVYAANGMWGEARLAFSNVVLLTPTQPLPRLYFAVAIHECGDGATAAKLLKTLTQQFSDFAPGFYRLGEMSLRTAHLEEAASAFQRLIALAPNEWRGYAGLGEVKLHQSHYAEAATLLEKALQINPDAGSAHHLLGQAYQALGRIEEAKLELLLGLDHVSYPMPDEWSILVPQHMKLLQDQFEIANEMASHGKATDAVLLLERAIAYHPENLGLFNNLAIALNRSGEPKKARSVAQHALKLNEQYLPAWITVSLSALALGQNEAALAAANKAIALSPGTVQAHLAKADVLLGMEQDQAALSELQTAFQCDSKNADVQVELGDVCWRNLAAPEEALKHYQTATNLNPALIRAYLHLADLHLEGGDTNAARSALRMAARLAPANPELPALVERLHLSSEAGNGANERSSR
jgi:tetratricopeptide (TPR) repeat protein